MTNGIPSETNGIPSDVTLLPCPFCGGEASVIDHHNDDGSVSVGCADDTCLGFSGIGWLYKTEDEAVEAWNRRAAVTDHDFAMAVHDGELWGKCSECRERQGHYLDAETIRNQQESIAELRRATEHYRLEIICYENDVDARDELIRDMHRVMWACREAACPHRENGCFRVRGNGDGKCWFEQRMREFGIEVDG